MKQTTLSSFRVLILVAIFVSVFFPSPAFAEMLLQEDDPIYQCAAGVFLYETGQTDEALPLLAAGFAGRDKVTFPNKEDLGNCALKLGLLLEKTKPEEALEAYAVAQAIFQQTDNKLSLAQTLYNTGVVYEGQGRYTEAFDLFDQAFLLTQEVGDRFGMGIILNEMGYIRRVQGRFGEARDLYLRARDIAVETNDEVGNGITLDNLGSLYAAQGQYEDALETFEEALTVKRKGTDGEGIATTLNNIGGIYAAQGDDVLALQYFQDAQKIMQEVPHDPSNMGAILTNIGDIYLFRKNYEEARKSYEAAYSLYESIGDPQGQAITLNEIGVIHAAEGLEQDALGKFRDALDISARIGDKVSEALALYNIGYTYQRTGEEGQAIKYYDQAMDLLDDVRSTSGNEMAKASFIDQYTDLYNAAIDLNYQQNHFEQAFFIAESGRARAFLDSLASNYVELSDESAMELFAREKEMHALRGGLQNQLLSAKATTPPDTELIAELEAKLERAQADYQGILDAIAARGNRFSQITPGDSEVLSIEQAKALLDDDMTLLSFWVLDDKTLVFLMTKKDFDVISLPVQKNELYSKINAYREFASTSSAYPEVSIDLYNLLIKPLLPHLQTRNLVIVPHGQLHYLPFAGLTDGKDYLLDRFTISYLPSVSAWPFIRQNAQHSGGTPLILGNPVTDQPELQGAEEEAKTVASILGVSPLLRDKATESAIYRNAATTSVLHVAAHASLNGFNPLQSTLYLTPSQHDDGYLEVKEIYGLDLSKSELVVLSACDTQRGNLSRGDELVGLTRAFFFAGAPSVIASLWEVDDDATRQLMEEFYASWKGGMSKTEALRQAQIAIRAEHPNPYYWAAFVLSGEDAMAGTPGTSSSSEKPAIPFCGSGFVLLGLVLGLLGRKISVQ